MKETIELIVKVIIEYPNKSRRKEAIKKAKECATSGSVLGSVSCEAKSAKLLKNKKNENNSHRKHKS